MVRLFEEPVIKLYYPPPTMRQRYGSFIRKFRGTALHMALDLNFRFFLTAGVGYSIYRMVVWVGVL